MPYDEELGEEEADGEDDEVDSTTRQRPASLESDGVSKSTSKKKKKKTTPPIRINLSACKYEVLRIVQRKLGWKEVGDDEDWEIYWTDTSVNIERVMKLTKFQKMNHFNGMLELCRKRSMARNLQKIQKLFPEHYDFFPITFILPSDLNELIADIKARGKKQVYILKPDAGCQGKGIRLIQGGKEEVLHQTLREMGNANIVAQHYLPKPYLINEYKFDMRIYALVLSCDPLRVFIFKEGLARICTEKYTEPKASNLGISFMHLTNYAVNKKNSEFVQNMGDAENAEEASKLGLEQLGEYIRSQGHDWDKVWESIKQLIMKSLISVQPILKNNYRSVMPIDNDGFSCFEILGYDVMLDEKLRPWLIEVNHSPSFTCDSPLDLAIKEQLITDTIQLVRIDPRLIAKGKRAEKKATAGRLIGVDMASKKGGGGGGGKEELPLSGDNTSSSVLSGKGSHAQKVVEELEAMRAEVLRKREKYEENNMGGYSRIYPVSDPKLQALYEELLRGAAEIYGSAFASRVKKTGGDQAGEDKRRDSEETESVKAQRQKAKAHRDKLAQMAMERRKLREQLYQAQKDGQYPYPSGQYPSSSGYPYYPEDGYYAPEPDYSYSSIDYGQYNEGTLSRTHSYQMPVVQASVVEASAAVSRLGFVSLPSSRPMSARSSGQEASSDHHHHNQPQQQHHSYPSSQQSPQVSTVLGAMSISGSPASLKSKISPSPTSNAPMPPGLPPPLPSYSLPPPLPHNATESRPGTSNNPIARQQQQLSQIVLPAGVAASHQEISAGGTSARSLNMYASAFPPSNSRHSQTRRRSSNHDEAPPSPAFSPRENNGLLISRSATIHGANPGSATPLIPPGSPSASSQRATTAQRGPASTLAHDSGLPLSPNPSYSRQLSGPSLTDPSYFRLDGTRVTSGPSSNSQGSVVQASPGAQSIARPESPSNFRYSRLHQQQPVSSPSAVVQGGNTTSPPSSLQDPYPAGSYNRSPSLIVPGAAAVAAMIHSPVRGRTSSSHPTGSNVKASPNDISSKSQPPPRGESPVSPTHRQQLRQAPLSISVAPTYSSPGRPMSPSSSSWGPQSPKGGAGLSVKPYVVLDPSRLGPPLKESLLKDDLSMGLSVQGRRERLDSRRER